MEKISNFLIGFVALSAFFSLYVGGGIVYLLFFSIALYAGFELIVSLRNKYNLKRQ